MFYSATLGKGGVEATNVEFTTHGLHSGSLAHNHRFRSGIRYHTRFASGDSEDSGDLPSPVPEKAIKRTTVSHYYYGG